ncbi:PREDICTED: regulator of cell cycle RGCC-like [Charadrius vociferus]|uniref:regulator of cell cycle RGCC-like n=1 Tax=Charadrius vociferus TaxID=50402 RepID=UPI000521580B|nr:PREDICTED: regulator of cell cycle RGCC-like [Charadrius vociferus]
MADELSELLREFDEVMEDFDRGPACQYEQHLEELKRKAGHSVYDSGIDELESTSTSPGSSLNSSEEDLNTPASAYPSKAKLGDTQELEEFIADLDKVLEEDHPERGLGPLPGARKRVSGYRGTASPRVPGNTNVFSWY